MYTHGLSDMAPWAGLAICGSPLRGEDRSSVQIQAAVQFSAIDHDQGSEFAGEVPFARQLSSGIRL